MLISKQKLIITATVLCCFSYGEGVVQIIMRLILLPSIAFYSMYNFRLRVGNINKKNLVTYILITIIIFSTLISSIISPAGIKPIWKSIEYLILVIIMYINIKDHVLDENQFDMYIKHIFKIINSVATFAIFIKFLRGDLYLFELGGSFPLINANLIGTIFGIQAVFYLVRSKILPSVVFLFLTFLSGSLSALLAIIFSLSVFFFLRKKAYSVKLPSVVKILFGVLICVTCIAYALQILDEEFLKMSGRLKIWQIMSEGLNLGTRELFLGVGLGGIRILAKDYLGYSVTLHNSYLELALSSGFVAIFCFLLLIVLFYIRMNFHQKRHAELIYISMFSFLVLKAFTTSNMVFISIESLFFVLLLMRYNNVFKISQPKQDELL